MLEPFITPTVATYNFKISGCNCSKSVLLLNRVLHWMQQVNIREILQSHQVLPMIHSRTLYSIPEIIFTSCESIREFGKIWN